MPPSPSRAPAHPQGFDVLRIVAACMVVVSHAFLLPDGSEPVVLPTGDFGFNLGRLGVIVFFVVSGYLVCGSWLSDPRPRSFAEKRARRLMPGLAVMLLLVTFVVGPLLTMSGSYFAQPQTYAYLVRNLLVFPYTYDLPGVFEDNPVVAVNGVLWTLGVEVTAYVLLAVAGLLGWLRRPGRLLAVAVVLALAGWRLPHEAIGDGLLFPVALRVEFVAYFFAAAAVRAYGWRPGLRSAVAAAGVVALLVLSQLPLSVLLVPALTVLVLYVGTRAWPAAPCGHPVRRPVLRDLHLRLRHPAGAGRAGRARRPAGVAARRAVDRAVPGGAGTRPGTWSRSGCCGGAARRRTGRRRTRWPAPSEPRAVRPPRSARAGLGAQAAATTGRTPTVSATTSCMRRVNAWWLKRAAWRTTPSRGPAPAWCAARRPRLRPRAPR